MPITQYKGDVASTGPSPIIWADCPILEMLDNPGVGYHLFDDFVECPNLDAGAGTLKGYVAYGTTGVTIKGQAAVAKGVAEVAGNDLDEDESVLTLAAPAFMVSDAAADAKKLWFEARVKKAAVTNNGLAMFVGLGFDHGAGVPLNKTLCLTDADGALGAFSYLGFHVDQAAGATMDFVYKSEAGAQTVLIAALQTMVLDTWYKVGFVYDPAAHADHKITVYLDSVKQTTYVTAALIAAAAFPDAEPMAPVWCAKVGTNAAETKAQMDWWRAAQLR